MSNVFMTWNVGGSPTSPLWRKRHRYGGGRRLPADVRPGDRSGTVPPGERRLGRSWRLLPAAAMSVPWPPWSRSFPAPTRASTTRPSKTGRPFSTESGGGLDAALDSDPRSPSVKLFSSADPEGRYDVARKLCGLACLDDASPNPGPFQGSHGPARHVGKPAPPIAGTDVDGNRSRWPSSRARSSWSISGPPGALLASPGSRP